MEVQLPELETLLLGSLGRRSPEASASRYENSRVEVSGEVKQRLPLGDRCAMSKNTMYKSHGLQGQVGSVLAWISMDSIKYSK